MPSGNRKRPDTLELEVLGGRQTESSDNEDCGVTARVLPRSHHHNYQLQTEQKDQAPKSQYFHAAKSHYVSDSVEKPSSTFQQTPYSPSQPVEKHHRKWFHLRRKPRPAPSAKAACDGNNELTAHTNTVPPKLVEPKTAAVANTTTTMCTSLPTSQTIPDVAAVLMRRNSKKRRSRTQTDSLYSLATLAQSGEICQQQNSEPNVPDSVANTTIAPEPWSKSSEKADTQADMKTAILLNEKNDASLPTSAYIDQELRDHMLLTSELTSVEEGVDGAMSAPVSGFQVRFLSILGKLPGWKRSECVGRRSRTTAATKVLMANDGSLDVNDEAESLSDHKKQKLNAGFEQFSMSPVENGAGSDKGVRRLSQMRRRRSSYYFSENERRIRANDREFNAQFKYADNFIKTSKYTLLTFLPFNLLEQFQRLANFYFLCLLVLQLIPAISSLTPVTTAIPLIGVLTLTAVKDAYDDIQRHLSDSQVNNRRSKTLRNGQLIDAKWSGVQVGDVIRLENNQFVAADILLLTTSEPNGLCFIETAELDGETNLKCKQCLPEITELGQRHDLLWNFNGEIICERPNNLLNKFEGTLIWRNQRYALDNEKILLRGCVLRNTQWCYGVVIFAGKDTKLMQNSGKTQFKSTGVDRLLNFIIIGIVLFLLSICAFFTLACAIWESFIGQHFQVYLPWENIIPKNVAQGSTVIGLLVFFSYAIVLNTVVPISLYVSVEVIRFAQSFLINWDEEMYYERSKTHAKARTTTLNEELGQIQYIFSDKTGTLTQNIMTFNKCSINGRTYGDVFDLRTGEVIEVTDKQKYVQNCNSKLSGNNASNKSTPAPTILLHSAEVHPKSTIMVSSPAEGGTADTSIAPPSLTTTPKEIPLPIATTTTTQAVVNPLDDDGKPSPTNNQRHVQYDESSIGTTVSEANAHQSPTCEIRSPFSTLSNSGDKVMIFGDSAPLHRALIVSYNNSNTTCCTPITNACTSTKKSPSINTTLLPLTIVNTPTTSTPTLSPTSTRSSSSLRLSSSTSSLTQITRTMHSDSLSQIAAFLNEPPSPTSTSSSTRKASLRTNTKNIGKTSVQCSTCNCRQVLKQSRSQGSMTSKLKSNLKSQSKTKLKQKSGNCTKCTHQNHNKSVRINTDTDTNSKSKSNCKNSNNTTTTSTDNVFNLYATNWSSSHHQQVHVCMRFVLD